MVSPSSAVDADALIVSFRGGSRASRAAFFVLLAIGAVILVMSVGAGRDLGIVVGAAAASIALGPLGFAAFYYQIAFDRPRIVVDGLSIREVHRILSGQVLWADLRRISAPASHGDDGFPRMIVFESHSPQRATLAQPEGRVTVVPEKFDAASDVASILGAALEHAAPVAVDLDVLCIYGSLIRRSRAESTPVRAPEAHSLEPAGGPARAMLIYLRGEARAAHALCRAQSDPDAGAWDVLLCQALCEQALGEPGYRTTLAASLAAEPPLAIARILEHNLSAGE